MANILGKASANDLNTPVTAVLNGVKIGLLFAVGFALVCMLQVTLFSSGAIASPLANIKLAETSKEFAKEAGNHARDLAKNVKEGTKENIAKVKESAKDTKDKIGNGVDKAKKIVSDRSDAVKDGAKDLPEKAGNKVNEAINSAKNFLGQ